MLDTDIVEDLENDKTKTNESNSNIKKPNTFDLIFNCEVDKIQ